MPLTSRNKDKDWQFGWILGVVALTAYPGFSHFFVKVKDVAIYHSYLQSTAASE